MLLVLRRRPTADDDGGIIDTELSMMMTYLGLLCVNNIINKKNKMKINED